MTLIRVCDLESTGLPEDEGSAVCEVGWCDIQFDERATVATAPGWMRVNPGVPIPPHIRAIHHISDADVANAPSPEEGFARLMEGPPDYFAAHGADFERHFFKGGDVPWIDSYKVAVRLYPDSVNHKNQTLRYLLGLDLPFEHSMPPHRAAPDAFVTAHVLAHFLNDGRASLGDMVRWATGPALLPRIPFGKHFGKKWDEVPIDYLKWIVDKSDLDGDIKANARHQLKKLPNLVAAKGQIEAERADHNAGG